MTLQTTQGRALYAPHECANVHSSYRVGEYKISLLGVYALVYALVHAERDSVERNLKQRTAGSAFDGVVCRWHGSVCPMRGLVFLGAALELIGQILAPNLAASEQVDLQFEGPQQPASPRLSSPPKLTRFLQALATLVQQRAAGEHQQGLVSAHCPHQH